jgi:pyrimidine operon attenuation protein/uracil phosphoribosyltransferase
VTLVVLVDRGGRELPIEPAFSAARISLGAGQNLRLTKDDAGRFSFDLKGG